MGLFDMFSTQPQNTPPADPAANPPAQPGNLPANPQGGTDPVVPGQNTPPAVGDDPLAQFKDIWEPTNNEGTADPNAPLLPLDPTKLTEVVKKAQFTGGITPEMMQQVAAGGEEAVAAFQQAMNSVAQNVMMQSTLASNKMIEAAVRKAVNASEAKIPSLLNKQQTLQSNPLFSNPAIKPVFEAVHSQLAAKNPTASPAELAQMTQDFITAVGGAFAPKADPSQQPGNDNFDWEAFLT